MDEHPGDTLGKRFLTFWGVLGAIVAVAALLGLYRLAFVNRDPGDGGAGSTRSLTLTTITADQEKEYHTVAEVEAGKTVRLPADAVISYAATVLKTQKAAPGPIKTPDGVAKEAAEKAANSHDENLSKFEGK